MPLEVLLKPSALGRNESQFIVWPVALKSVANATESIPCLSNRSLALGMWKLEVINKILLIWCIFINSATAVASSAVFEYSLRSQRWEKCTNHTKRRSVLPEDREDGCEAYWPTELSNEPLAIKLFCAEHTTAANTTKIEVKICLILLCLISYIIKCMIKI